jgi:Dolichyl-phosphate-mannose-protein mannosyltransferase
MVARYWGQAGHALALALAVAVRAFVLARAQGMLDGDEALFGLQAEHILRGDFSIYLYGQPYMGSLEAYLSAPFIALFGPSGTVLHIAPLLESLVFILLLGAVAGRLFGPRARLYAMLLAALPPLYVSTGELHTWGGYEPTLVCGTALMLVSTHLAQRWTEGRPTRILWLWIGLLLGLGVWVDPLVIYFVIASALWLAPYAYARVRRGMDMRAAALAALVCGAGGLVGFAPGLIYAVQNHYANIKFILDNNGSVGQFNRAAAQMSASDPLRLSVLHFIWTVLVPRLAGSQLMWGGSLPGALVPVGITLTALALIYGLIVAIGTLAGQRAGPSTATFHDAWRWLFAIFLVAVVVVIYWHSPYSNLAVRYPDDFTGRYALPSVAGLTLALAAFFADAPSRLSAFVRRLGRPAVADHARASDAQRASPVRASVVGHVVAPLLLLALLVANALPYFNANLVVAMQSPYRQRDLYPAVDANLLTYLEQHHIHDIWAIHWIGNVIMFQTDERIIAGDLRLRDRFPQNVQTLLAADRPTYVVEADPSRGESLVAKALDAMHVRYVAVPFEHWWAITPLSRAVSPLEIQAAIAPTYDR